MTRVNTANTLAVDHNNSGLYLDGCINDVEFEDYYNQRKIEAADQLNVFEDIWNTVSENLQDPIQDEGKDRFSGFTGHRIVEMTGRMGRCALGFHLLKIGSDDYRTITAYRRKVYSRDRRRLHYVSDSLAISSSDIVSLSPEPVLDYQLGILSRWVSQFDSVTERE